MFDIPSVRIGKIFGVPVEVNLSWLVIFALVAFSLATSYFPSIPAAKGAPAWLFATLGAVTALLFFASVLAHELSHSLVVRAEGGTEEIPQLAFEIHTMKIRTRPAARAPRKRNSSDRVQ